MLVSGKNLSLFGRSALSNVGESRTSMRPELDPVNPTDPTRDTTSSEYKELQDLKQRDREVRQHEQAHVAAGGAHVRGGVNFSYASGPDGKQYATGGEVSIDSSAVSGDPAATIRKMQAVKAAALAPAEPSAQDRSVAAAASQAEAQARADLREQQQEEREPQTGEAFSRRSQDAVEAYQGAAATAQVAQQQQPSLDLIA